MHHRDISLEKMLSYAVAYATETHVNNINVSKMCLLYELITTSNEIYICTIKNNAFQKYITIWMGYKDSSYFYIYILLPKLGWQQILIYKHLHLWLLFLVAFPNFMSIVVNHEDNLSFAIS